MENTYVLTLTSNLGHIASANDYIIKNCEIFFQTVLYSGTSKEAYVETTVRLYKNNNKKEFNVTSTKFCHANKLFVEQIISRIIGLYQQNFPSNFTKA